VSKLNNTNGSLKLTVPEPHDLKAHLQAHLVPLPRIKSAIFMSACNPLGLRAAGVLVPIINRTDGRTVLLTLRSQTLSTHAGQISFPGGSVDPDDADVVETALRETWEETGIDASFVAPLGGIEPVESVTGFLLFPVVAILRPDFTAIANPGEVDAIFEVPLAFVMDEANHVHKTMSINGVERDYFSIVYGPYDIWGATARILVNLSRQIDCG
jgi:8-oxo-dGTP pyrophosphatase MutT (NUDIX family)